VATRRQLGAEQLSRQRNSGGAASRHRWRVSAAFGGVARIKKQHHGGAFLRGIGERRIAWHQLASRCAPTRIARIRRHQQWRVYRAPLYKLHFCAAAQRGISNALSFCLAQRTAHLNTRTAWLLRCCARRWRHRTRRGSYKRCCAHTRSALHSFACFTALRVAPAHAARRRKQ